MKIVPTIYSLVYPETQSLTEKLWKSNPLYLYENSYTQPEYQIESQNIFRDQWIQWSSSQVHGIDLAKFKFYNTAGSSEAIRESLADFASKGGKSIYVFKGDYEGYKALAEAYGLNVIDVDRNQWKKLIVNDNSPFYISQPSSIDGNVWSEFEDFLVHMDTQKSRLMVDLCYVGTSSVPLNINLEHSCVDSVFFSLSKVFGVYFHRIGGVFTKSEYKGLIGNQWFKNLFSLKLGTELLKTYDINYFPSKYKNIQQAAILELSNDYPKAIIKASDVLILATSKDTHPDWNLYQRNPLTHYRFCLTPVMDKMIKSKK